MFSYIRRCCIQAQWTPQREIASSSCQKIGICRPTCESPTRLFSAESKKRERTAFHKAKVGWIESSSLMNIMFGSLGIRRHTANYAFASLVHASQEASMSRISAFLFCSRIRLSACLRP
nr:hypothetical protein CFP56_37188 [Quercus suber]